MKNSADLVMQTAASLDLPETLAPFASLLMRDIEALGSYPAPTAALCKKLGINSKSAVLDLACGKGSIAIELAATLGCNVTAVDASPEFIASAKFLASSRGVKPRFVAGDVSAFKPRAKFDLVIMLNLFPLEEAADCCRGLVKSGGIFLIDDATLAKGAKSKRWSTTQELRAILEEEGDKVLAMSQIPASLVGKNARAIEKQVKANGVDLIKLHPRLKPAVKAYITRLERSRTMLTGDLRPTLFAVRAL